MFLKTNQKVNKKKEKRSIKLKRNLKSEDTGYGAGD